MTLRLFLPLVVALLSLKARAGEWVFQDFPIFHPEAVEVRWSITNDPASNALRLFRVVPRQFSPLTISNLLSLGGLLASDRRTVIGGSPGNDAMHWVSATQGLNNLMISARQGLVDLRRRSPNKHGQSGDLVPSIPATIEKGSNLFVSLFGVATNELSYKPNGQLWVSCMEDIGESLDNTRKRVKAVARRGVTFYRTIDGCVVYGGGTAGFYFEDRGVLNMLELVWRGIEPSGEVPKPHLDYFKKALANGDTVLMAHEVAPSKRLIIQHLDYCYEEKPASEVQAVFFPFARLSGTAYDDHTNGPVMLFCRLPSK